MTDERDQKAIEAGAPARPENPPPPHVTDGPRGDSGANSTSGSTAGSASGAFGSATDDVGSTQASEGSESALGTSVQPPAGFGARFIAYVLDLIIVSVLSVPLKIGFAAFWAIFPFPFFGEWTVVDWLARTATTVLYFGWFYKEKGASPGKMLLGIEVLDIQGRRLTYGQTFAREVIGKIISAIPLMLGYLIAAFRPDGKALHDLLFDTRVVVPKPTRRQ